MRRLVLGVAIMGSAFVIAACGSGHGNSPIGPSAPSAAAAPSPGFSEATAAPSLFGTWVSSTRLTAASTVSLSVCANIQMQITNQTAAQASGTLSMDCPGNLRVSGTITGQLGGSTIPLTWNGTATQPGFPVCPFSLTGTGTPLTFDTFHITYSGSSCTGPIDGADTLRLSSSLVSPPAPPAPAPSAPAPVPTVSGWQTCGSTAGPELVACVQSHIHPARTVEGAFETTKRVAWLLRGQGVGLLLKPGGENIVSWKGQSFSAARICLPNGQLYKILTDVPTTNGPSWQDNGFVSPSLYVPAIFPE